MERAIAFSASEWPAVRRVAREFRSLSLRNLRSLLASQWHEERLLALAILTQQYARGNEAERDAIYTLYLHSTDRINNWDLVDVSAAQIVGAHLANRDRAPLRKLAKSRSVWERRMAMMATFHFIRAGEFADTFALTAALLNDPHAHS